MANDINDPKGMADASDESDASGVKLPADRDILDPGNATFDDTMSARLSDRDVTPDPADEIPVPVAMSPAEIDERAQAVEAVRKADPETGIQG